MEYYKAQERYIDEDILRKFIDRCPDGYTVKGGYVFHDNNRNPRYGYWAFYYYCKNGVTLEKKTLQSFFKDLDETLEYLSMENHPHYKLTKHREDNKQLYANQGSLNMLEKAKLAKIELECLLFESNLRNDSEIVGSEYDIIWDQIAGSCSYANTENLDKCYIYTCYDSDSLREAYLKYYKYPTDLFMVHDVESSVNYLEYYCYNNQTPYSEKMENELRNSLKNKDKKTSYGTVLLKYIIELERRMTTPKHNDKTSANNERELNFCPACGAKIRTSDTFCPTCGCRIE